MCGALLLKSKVILQDVQHQTEGVAVSSAPLLHRLGGSAAVCQAMGCTMMGSVALLLVSSSNSRWTDVIPIDKHSDYSIYVQPFTLCSHLQFLLQWILKCYVLYLSGPSSFLVVANLVDVRQINPDGSGDQILVEEPNGAIIALDYDPVENKVISDSFQLNHGFIILIKKT